MKLEDLSAEARANLDEIVEFIQDALDASDVPHLRLVMHTYLEDTVLTGAAIPGKDRKPVKHDKRALAALIRTLMADTSIRSLIIACERDDSEQRFSLNVKIVSLAEYKELLEQRKEIDQKILTILRGLGGPNRKKANFGRSIPKKPLNLTVVTSDGVERPEPTEELLAAYAEAEAVYSNHGHRLVSSTWAIRGKRGADIYGHFE